MSREHEFVLLLLFCKFMPLLLAAGNRGSCPPSFQCGYLGNISFPFTITGRLDCGFLSIENCDDPHKLEFIQLPPNGNLFQVVNVAQPPSTPTTTHFTTFQIRDQHLYELLQNRSCEAFRNTYTLPRISPFAAFRLLYNATLILCNHTLHVNPPTNISKSKKEVCHGYDLYYKYIITNDDKSSLAACKMVQLPIKDLPDASDPFTFVTGDVTIKVELTDQCSDCYYRQGGQCRLDSTDKFCCANSYGTILCNFKSSQNNCKRLRY